MFALITRVRRDVPHIPPEVCWLTTRRGFVDWRRGCEYSHTGSVKERPRGGVSNLGAHNRIHTYEVPLRTGDHLAI